MDANEIYETWINGNRKDAYLAIRDAPNPAYKLALVAAVGAPTGPEEYAFLAWFINYTDSCGDAA